MSDPGTSPLFNQLGDWQRIDIPNRKYVESGISDEKGPTHLSYSGGAISEEMRERVEAMIRDQRANGSIQYRFAKALLCDLLVGQSLTITKFGDPMPQEISLLDHGAYISYPLSDSTVRDPQKLQINVSKD